jgi:hypothetical protein
MCVKCSFLPFSQGPVQQVAHGSAQPETALLLGSLTQATFLNCGVSGADSSALLLLLLLLIAS